LIVGCARLAHALTLIADTTPSSSRARRTVARIPFLALVLCGVTLTLSAPALAKKAPSCGQQVINDWQDGRIDKSYPVHCYNDALKLVPPDARQYSSLPTDIERALLSASNGIVPAGQLGHAFGAKYSVALAELKTFSRLAQPFNHRDEIALPLGEASPLAPGLVCLIAGCGSSPTGLPLPLIILGSIAILLLAAGTAGMVMRKLQERRLPPPGTA
jgi:hypothetical protein